VKLTASVGKALRTFTIGLRYDIWIASKILRVGEDIRQITVKKTLAQLTYVDVSDAESCTCVGPTLPLRLLVLSRSPTSVRAAVARIAPFPIDFRSDNDRSFACARRRRLHTTFSDESRFPRKPETHFNSLHHSQSASRIFFVTTQVALASWYIVQKTD